MADERKARGDAWDATLADKDRWALYDETRNMEWVAGAAVASDKYGVELPSRSGWYRWLARMRKEDAQRRIERAAASVAEAGAIAEHAGCKDSALIGAYKALAADAAMTDGDSGTAQRYVQMAMSIADRSAKARELELKAAAQATKEAELALARQKFEAAEARLDAVKGAVAAPEMSDAERLAKVKAIFGM